MGREVQPVPDGLLDPGGAVWIDVAGNAHVTLAAALVDGDAAPVPVAADERREVRARIRPPRQLPHSRPARPLSAMRRRSYASSPSESWRCYG